MIDHSDHYQFLLKDGCGGGIIAASLVFQGTFVGFRKTKYIPSPWAPYYDQRNNNSYARTGSRRHPLLHGPSRTSNRNSSGCEMEGLGTQDDGKEEVSAEHTARSCEQGNTCRYRPVSGTRQREPSHWIAYPSKEHYSFDRRLFLPNTCIDEFMSFRDGYQGHETCSGHLCKL
jgi:hypothetical protein